MNTTSAQPTEKRVLTTVVSIVSAGLAYILFDSFLNDFFSTQLREMSSHIAHLLLNLFYLDVSLNGTILAIGEFRFEVIAACNGSSTLKVLIGFGIFLSGTNPKLNLNRKITAAFLAIPIAILANGARVAMLVAGSVALNEPIAEGTLHTAIGLIGFALAMIGFMIAMDALSFANNPQKKQRNLKPIAIALLSLFIYGPFLYSMITGWIGESYNPFNHWGIAFFCLAFIMGAIIFQRAENAPSSPRWVIFILALAYITVLLSYLIDLKFLLGISLVFFLTGIWGSIKGNRLIIPTISSLAIFLLSYPKIPLQINSVTTRLGFEGWSINLSIRVAIGLVLVLIYFWGLRKQKMHASNARSVLPYPYFMLISSLILVSFQTFFSSAPLSSHTAHTLDLSYQQGPWIGDDLPIAPESTNYFGRGNIWVRQYRHDNNKATVIINSSGGDRHRNHPPEYCQTGAGWEIVKSETVRFELKEYPVTGTLLTLTKEEKKMHFAYWFSDGQTNYSDYVSMMAQDTARRLIGKKTNWFLFRAHASNTKSLRSFLKNFKPKIIEIQRSVLSGQ